MMDPLLIEKRAEIEALCRTYGVQRLYVFGSAATGTRRVDSDYDFSIVYDSINEKLRGLAYFSLVADLSDLLGYPVDLVDESAVKNPYFKSSLEDSKILLYETNAEVILA